MPDNTHQKIAMRSTASGKLKEGYDELLRKEPLTVQEALAGISLYFVDDDVADTWATKLTQIDKERWYLTADERRLFHRYLYTQFAKLVTYQLDPLSRVFVRGHESESSYTSFHIKWPQCIISNFKSVGCYGCIDGVPRSGKTSLACTFMKMFHKDFGINTITNIKFKKKPEYVFYAQKLSTLVIHMEKQKRWVCILDETATFADKKTALKRENIDFESLARFVGKMGGRMLLVTHSFSRDVPTRLQEWTTELYTKLSKTTVNTYNQGQFYKGMNKIKDVPDTELKFVTEDITSLLFDININELLASVQNGVSVEEAIEAQAKQPQRGTRIATKKAMVLREFDFGNFAYEEMAKKYDTTYQLIMKYHRVWKDGKGLP